MKKIVLLVILSVSFLFSCKNREAKETKATEKLRTSAQIKLQKFDFTKFGIKELNSIRAIDIIGETIYFVGEQGKIYTLFPNGKLEHTADDFFGDKPPVFRAVAHANNKLYAISIGSPTLLFQIEINQGTLQNPKLVYTENYKQSFYDAIAFFDDNNGIAIGDPVEDCLSIIITNDSGNSWKKIPCKNLPKLIKGEAAFAASNTNIAIQGSEAWVITGGMQSRVMHTKDMGKTWEITKTPMIKGTESTGAYSVTFYDKNNGYICGGDYLNKKGNTANKAFTSNGGKTWELIADTVSPGYISCVQYVPNKKGKELFAVSTEGIYFSNNSGNTWSRINKEGYYTIKFLDENQAWLAGNNKIAKILISN